MRTNPVFLLVLTLILILFAYWIGGISQAVNRSSDCCCRPCCAEPATVAVPLPTPGPAQPPISPEQ